MGKDLNIFVIIVTYKGKQWYNKCFDSLRESTIPVQTIVVDNTPSDEDAEYIKEHYPEVHLIKTNENLGFGRANNLGMRYALDNECDYVFLLNQDAWLEAPNTLEKLVRIFEEHPEYGILSPMHINPAKTKLVMDEFSSQTNNGKLLSDLYCGKVDDIYEANYVNAAAWLLKRSTLETIGGFCPLFIQYGEDDDYINRLHYHGMKLGVVPAARIIHDCEIKSSESVQLFTKANRENIDVFLNINNNQSIKSLRRYFLRKWLIGMFRQEQFEYYRSTYFFLRDRQHSINECRELHKIKQANWL